MKIFKLEPSNRHWYLFVLLFEHFMFTTISTYKVEFEGCLYLIAEGTITYSLIQYRWHLPCSLGSIFLVFEGTTAYCTNLMAALEWICRYSYVHPALVQEREKKKSKEMDTKHWEQGITQASRSLWSCCE